MRTTSDLVAPALLPIRTIPGPRAWPLIGHSYALLVRPIETFVEGIAAHGDIVRFRFFVWPAVLVNRPDLAQQVLVDQARSYIKSPSYRMLRVLLGDGLVTAEGEAWRSQRRMAQPAFHRQRLEGFVDTFARVTEELVADWHDGDPIDIHHAMIELTARAVGLTLFGTDLDGAAGEIRGAIDQLMKLAAGSGAAALWLPRWAPAIGNRRLRRATATLDRVIYGMIEERQRSGDFGNDLLGMLMAATDESGTERLTNLDLRNMAMTLFVAGHETTANALSWTWALLAQHPEAAARLRAEIDEVLGDRPLTIDALPRLVYTGRVIDEAMRLYPPAYIVERQATEDVELGGYALRKGTIVMIPPYTLHRNPDWWENPERFDPDRFAPERTESRPKLAFMPFGAGPRMCIGNNFALMEAKVMLALLARRHHLELRPGADLSYEAGITLRPKHGIPMTVRALGPAERAAGVG